MMTLDTRIENGKRAIEGWDRVFKALSAEPRRQIIVSLLDSSADEPISLPENATNPNIPTDSERLRQRLHHLHLPLLAEEKFIYWKPDPFIAGRGPQFDMVAIVFEAIHGTSAKIPDSLVTGCQRLEEEREMNF